MQSIASQQAHNLNLQNEMQKLFSNSFFKRLSFLILFGFTTNITIAQSPPHDISVVLQNNFWLSEWTEFEVPEGLASFQILSSGSNETLIQVTDLIDPNGQVYVQSGSSPTLNAYSQPVLRNVLSSNRSEAVVHGMGTLIVPNNPKLPSPTAGKWRMRILNQTEPLKKKNSFVIVQKTNADLAKNKLAVRVWISPETYWSADTNRIDKLLAETKNKFFKAGIQLEVLSINLLPKRITKDLKLPQDMETIALQNNSPDSINIYLMPQMEYQNKPINGLACIGGPGARAAPPHPCFVSMYASTDAPTVDLSSQAKILTHELGHYLGLFHTVDNDYPMIGKVFDFLDDTPEEVTGQNIMDPGIHNSSPSFSNQQKAILRLSPALQ